MVEPGRGVGTAGRLYSENIWVAGSFTVKSCCGFPTNDVEFEIEGRDIGGKNYGRVVNGLTFDWNTGRNEKFFLFFDNSWGTCRQGVCGIPDPSSPSYHNKTIELTVREVAPAKLTNASAFSWYIPPVLPAAIAATILVGITVFTVEHYQRKWSRKYGRK